MSYNKLKSLVANVEVILIHEYYKNNNKYGNIKNSNSQVEYSGNYWL